MHGIFLGVEDKKFIQNVDEMSFVKRNFEHQDTDKSTILKLSY